MDNHSNPNTGPTEKHSHDGIEEADHSMPPWWLNGFFLTIIFALLYFSYYFVGEGQSIKQEYTASLSTYEHEQAARKSLNAHSPSEEDLRALLKDKGRIQEGKAVFAVKCVSCHGQHGEGGIGPNLTDDYWIHGGKMTEILATVTNGVLDKGMPPWGALLKPEELQSVVAFVKSIRGTHPPNAKGPQGILVKE